MSFHFVLVYNALLITGLVWGERLVPNRRHVSFEASDDLFHWRFFWK